MGDRPGGLRATARDHRQPESRTGRRLRLQPSEGGGRCRHAGRPAADGRDGHRRQVRDPGLDADVVLHAASKATRDNTNTDDIVELLASGKSVITTTSYSHLPTYGRETEQRITNACKRSGARFHAAGEHPGFMFERLATTLTGLSQRVDRIAVSEFVDCSAVSEKGMLVDLMGMGKDPAEISVDAPCSGRSRYSTNSPWPRRRYPAPGDRRYSPDH